MTDTITIRTNLLLLYPQFKPKFEPPSNPDNTTELTRIGLIIDDARLEVDLKVGLLDTQAKYDKALTLLSCHNLKLSQAQGFNNGSIEWEERQNIKTNYSKRLIAKSPHNQTQFGEQYDAFIESLQQKSERRYGIMLI